jgi:hypothetical protein
MRIQLGQSCSMRNAQCANQRKGIQMSNISNRHSVAKLEKNSKALSGQRMARVIAKKNKEGQYESANLTESKFVSIPIVSAFTQEQLTALTPHIVGLVNDAQDALIRDAIIETGATSIEDSAISVDACIAYLDDAAKGNRVTGEYLAKWFTETYLEAAMQFVCAMSKFDADALTPDQEVVVMQKCNTLSSMFAGFASGKYSPDIPKCKGMIKFGEFVGVDNQDARMQNFLSKAVKIKTEKELELNSDALGF